MHGWQRGNAGVSFPGIVGTEGNDDVPTVGQEDYLMAGWIAHVKDCGSRLETGVRRHV
jgi:hypothetical protein